MGIYCHGCNGPRRIYCHGSWVWHLLEKVLRTLYTKALIFFKVHNQGHLKLKVFSLKDTLPSSLKLLFFFADSFLLFRSFLQFTSFFPLLSVLLPPPPGTKKEGRTFCILVDMFRQYSNKIQFERNV